MGKRIVFLDYMRVIACFMVIMVHSCEFFFIDGANIGIRTPGDGFWVSVIDSAFRCSVPLFVIISAYLLVPISGAVSEFFKKRFVRVLVPFIVWSVLYATLPALWGAMDSADVVASLMRLAYNFNDASGHMWFIYMLIGLYLFMPVISPWLEKAGKKSRSNCSCAYGSHLRSSRICVFLLGMCMVNAIGTNLTSCGIFPVFSDMLSSLIMFGTT